MNVRALFVVLFNLANFAVHAATRELHGTVWLLGSQNAEERTPVVGAQISLKGVGNRVQSAAGGEFRLSLPEAFEAGDEITLVVEYGEYQVFHPAGGRTKVGKDLRKQSEDIELLPAGSKRFWADAQIEALVHGAVEESKAAPKGGSEAKPADFTNYIEAWAKARGLGEQETLAEIDRWAKKVKAEENDVQKLGLAAFAEKNFRRAEDLYTQSAEAKARELETRTREVEHLTESTIADYRQAGNAALYDNRFRDALTKYQAALKYAPQEGRSSLWAAVSLDIATAQWALGIHVSGEESQALLANATETYKSLLRVYTRAQLPQQWAMTQLNLGAALHNQGTRTGGEPGAKLLAEAVAAYRAALEVYTRAQLPQDWATTQNNLGTALRDQGIRTGGDAGAKLLAEAVAAFRAALEVHTREQLPQQWAVSQNNLGAALYNQGIRTGGDAGAKLLAEAVAAFRAALEVHTREQLPQQWAASQNNLGAALRDQGIRTGGDAGAKLLAEAVAAFRAALEVHTRAQLPQDWAMTQNNLGAALYNQGIRTGGEPGAKLLAQAVAAFRAALEVHTAQLPQDWAMTQNNLGAALRDQGIRTGGDAGAKLLAEAVAAFRAALEVHTRAQLPQQWAMTQNNLGTALRDQGIRTGGEAGAKLLAEAVAAFRAALEVHTREQLPQQWAASQNNLGTALRDQGIRTGGDTGAKLLAEAVAAFRAALEVGTKAHLPDYWRQTTRNLATTYVAYGDWENALALYKELYEFDPTDADAYTQAGLLFHEILFKYLEAYALNKQWLSAHPDDVSAQCDFAERHFTTGRFDEAARRLADLISKPNLSTEVKVALQAIEVANAVARGQVTTVGEQMQTLRALVAEQSEDFKVGWSFSGTKHFVETQERLAPKRAWLLNLFAALEQQNRAAILKGLDALQPADGAPN